MSNHQGYKISKVLDVGCSHGLGVKRLWELGFQASGVDLSAVAVRMARINRKPPRRRGQSRDEAATKWCVGTCFQQSSATSLPFANGTFDATLSTDVLEHLPPEDVPVAVSELARVTRRLLFLKIAPRKEALGAELSRLRAQLQNASGEASRAAPPAPNSTAIVMHASAISSPTGASPATTELLPAQLHLTVRDTRFWLAQFEQAGFVLHHRLEEVMKWQAKFKHLCCSFVLERGAPTRPVMVYV